MRGFERIDSVINDLDNSLSNRDKIDLLLIRIRDFLIEEGERRYITFPSGASTKDLLIGLNFIMFEYRPRKKFNTKLIISITTVMSFIQKSPVIFKTEQNLSLRDFPVYIYDENNNALREIKGHNKTDNLNVALSLIDYLSKSYYQDLPSSKKYVPKE